MKLNTILIFCLFISYNAFCQKPKSIDEAVNMLLDKFTEEDKANFKRQSESDAVSELHMSVGMTIRNAWVRHGDERLKAEFNTIGVFHPDDMSSIILTSAHRKLNNIPVNINGQAQYYIDYWKPIIEKDKNDTAIAEKHYNENAVGDMIKIYYPVNDDGGDKSAILYTSDWDFNPKKDLIITGVISKKYFINSESNVFFDLKITDMTFPSISVLGTKMKPGEEHMFNLKWLKIEKVKRK